MKQLLVLLVVATAQVLAGCADEGPQSPDPESSSTHDDWVVVVYDASDADPTLSSLVDTEVAADEALQEAGAGLVDGNEVGQGRYKSFYVGSDREEMWRILGPILAEGPVRWRRVELRDGLEDKDPQVIAN